ncbi:cupin domain-containing protein [Steroidobacter flavus]|uniref:Cupin domain-containing protein n=1 Tax=Steroidobacter flavus TaxID=1842136 RepID=A0ABV8T043_9GAMM
MLLNADLAKRTVVHGARLDWVSSPAQGVERRMLFRIGAEKARATSIVRYAPGSRFSRHEHAGGEEFLVLEGVFQDETGDFPAGTYVRNPPGTGHAPGSESGCTIFVKLWQFKQSDRERVVRLPGEGTAASRILFEGSDERVVIEEWQANAQIELLNGPGLELLVLAGACFDGIDTLDRWTWLRLPAGQPLRVRVGSQGAHVWYKIAPLLHEDVCAFDEK